MITGNKGEMRKRRLKKRKIKKKRIAENNEADSCEFSCRDQLGAGHEHLTPFSTEKVGTQAKFRLYQKIFIRDLPLF